MPLPLPLRDVDLRPRPRLFGPCVVFCDDVAEDVAVLLLASATTAVPRMACPPGDTPGETGILASAGCALWWTAASTAGPLMTEPPGDTPDGTVIMAPTGCAFSWLVAVGFDEASSEAWAVFLFSSGPPLAVCSPPGRLLPGGVLSTSSLVTPRTSALPPGDTPGREIGCSVGFLGTDV